jgi:alpha-tubulin suppressor-like RCC1 family protein
MISKSYIPISRHVLEIILFVICISSVNSERFVATFDSNLPLAIDRWKDITNMSPLQCPTCQIEVVKFYGRRLVLSVTNGTVTESMMYDFLVDQEVLLVERDLSVIPLVSSALDNLLYTSVYWSTYNRNAALGRINVGKLTTANTSNPFNVTQLLRPSNCTGTGHIVGILDSGLAASSFNLIGNVLPGYDFISDVSVALDGDGRDANFFDPGDADGIECTTSSWHGTGTTSIVAAEAIGVAPDTTVVPIRVLGRCRSGYASDVTDGIIWAIGAQINGLENNRYSVDTVMMAFAGLGVCPDFLQSAVDSATLRNVTVLAAAGNDGLDASKHFPANCVGVVSVGALDAQGTLTSYSSRNATVNQLGSIPCLSPDGVVTTCTGTSSSVAYQGGLQACTRTRQKSLPSSVIWDIYHPLSASNEVANSNETVTAGTHTSPSTSPTTCDIGESIPTIVHMDAGMDHNCALLSDNTMKCWGPSNHGQLGVGSLGIRNVTPYAVQIALGGYHTCAILSDNTMKCWGWNYYGQLGIGDDISQPSPVEVLGLGTPNVTPYAVQIACGSYHTCAILSDNTMKCWGSNDKGQLGNNGQTGNTGSYYLSPVQVPGMSVVQIALGDSHTCAILSDNTMKCWGNNYQGALGTGNRIDQPSPAGVVGLDTPNVTPYAVQITCGVSHTCAILSDHTLKCWGYNNVGALGISTNSPDPATGFSFESSPAGVSGLSTPNVTPYAVQITCGAIHTCAILSDNTMKCWGSNYYGHLGIGNTENQLSPVEVIGLGIPNVTPYAVQLVIGGYHTCAMLSDYTVKCGGRNNAGQLGIALVSQYDTLHTIDEISTCEPCVPGSENCLYASSSSSSFSSISSSSNNSKR